MSPAPSNLRELVQRFAQPGRLDAIWLRPARGAAMQAAMEVLAVAAANARSRCGRPSTCR